MHQLTPRENEVIEHLAKGLKPEQVAQALHISHGTVRNHIARCKIKTGAKTTPHLVYLWTKANE